METQMRDMLQTAQEFEDQGQIDKEIEILERLIFLRKDQFGLDSIQFWDLALTLVQRYNALAMDRLKHLNSPQFNDSNDALHLLQKAQLLTERKCREASHEPYRMLWLAITFSNLGCYHRQCNQLRMALKCTDRALRIETRLASSGWIGHNAASTHLNMCTILSDFGRHRSALDHAQAALDYTKAAMQRDLDRQGRPAPMEVDGLSVNEVSLSEEERSALWLQMGIAYHNIAVEQEHMQRFDVALMAYQRAYEFCYLYLKDGHPLTNEVFSKLNYARQHFQLHLRRNDPGKYQSTRNRLERFAIARTLARSSRPLPASFPNDMVILSPNRLQVQVVANRMTSSSKSRREKSLQVKKRSRRKKSTLPELPPVRISGRSSFDVVRTMFGGGDGDEGICMPQTERTSTFGGIHRNGNRTSTVLGLAMEADGYWSDGPVRYSCHSNEYIGGKRTNSSPGRKRLPRWIDTRPLSAKISVDKPLRRPPTSGQDHLIGEVIANNKKAILRRMISTPRSP